MKHIAIMRWEDADVKFGYVTKECFGATGTHCIEKVTLGGSFYIASLSLEDTSSSSEFVAVVETKLFGL